MFLDWGLGERDKQADSYEIHVDSTKTRWCSIESHEYFLEIDGSSTTIHECFTEIHGDFTEVHEDLTEIDGKSILTYAESLFSFQEVSAEKILKQEHEWMKLAYQKWSKIKNLYVLGQSLADRLPIFSIVVTHPETNRFIHHNFICALLNDLLGIQARGGCACAGPYAEVRRYVICLTITAILVKFSISISLFKFHLSK